MAQPAQFDAHYTWLGIPSEEQPAHHYRLLDIRLYESSTKLIDTGYNRRMAYLRGIKDGEYLEQAEKLKDELATARHCLVTPAKKAIYDAELKERLAALAPRSTSLLKSEGSTVDVATVVHDLTFAGLIDPRKLEPFVPPAAHPKDASQLADQLVKSRHLTPFQAARVSAGKARSLILGNYVLLEEIGVGGMGVIYKARHRRMERIVALKVMNAECMGDARAVERFEREARAAARLSHPNIVAAHDADEADGLRFLVIEFVDGDDLSVVERRRRPLPVAEAIDFIQQTARGLAYAHAQGVVHRDIKPSNLLLDKSGTVKILDMGLARVESEGDLATQAELTGTSTVLGTVDYMAPEQALSAKRADARSDLYSLGCTLYRLLTGRELYPGDTVVQKIMAHRSRAVPSLRAVRPEVPVELEALFAQMVAKQPSDRTQRAQDVVDRLEVCKRAGASAPTSSPSAPDATVQWNAESQPRRASTLPEPLPRLHAPPPAAPPPGLFPAPGFHFDVPKLRPAAPQEVPRRPTVAVRGGNGNRRVLAIALSAAGGFMLLLAVWIIVRDKQGNEVARIQVPEQGSVTIVDGVPPVVPTATSVAKPTPATTDASAVTPRAVPLPSPSASVSPPSAAMLGVGPTGSTTEPFDDRTAAEWILRRGWYVEILVDDVTRTIRSLAALPRTPFRLSGMFGSAFVDIPITADDLRRLAPLKLRKMYIERAGLSDAHLPLIVNNPELRELVVFQNYGVTDRGLEQIKRCTQLELLSIQRTRATNAGMAHLAPLTKLKILKVSDTPIDDTGLAVVANFPELEELHASWCPITGEFAGHLAKSKIKVLSPGGAPTRINAAGMAAIASLKTLETLNLAGTDPIEEAWFAPFADHPTLKTLDLRDCQVDDGVFAHFRTIPQLTELTIASTLVTPQGVTEFRRAKPNCRVIGAPVAISTSRPISSPAPTVSRPIATPTATPTSAVAMTSTTSVPTPKPKSTAMVRPAPAADSIPRPAVAPFRRDRADAAQLAWSKYLELDNVAVRGENGSRMILIPPGRFLMGSNDAQVASALDFSPSLMIDSKAQARVREGERPQHQVVLTKPYFLCEQETTVGQFRKFVEATKYVTEAEKFGFGNSDAMEADGETPEEDKKKNWRTPGYVTREDAAVTQVTWNDAVIYCNWLSEQEKLTPAYRLQTGNKTWVCVLAADGYRLPTEAEWEFACRAGTTTHFWFGDDPKLADSLVSGETSPKDQSLRTMTKTANPFGLCDMHGGVWEWCQDGYDWRYYSVTPEKDPQGAYSPLFRVARGGDRFESSVYCRSAARVNQALTFRGKGHGFRVARNAPAAP